MLASNAGTTGGSLPLSATTLASAKDEQEGMGEIKDIHQGWNGSAWLSKNVKKVALQGLRGSFEIAREYTRKLKWNWQYPGEVELAVPG